MQKFTAILIAGLVPAFHGAAQAQAPRPAQPAPTTAARAMGADSEFAQKAAMGGKHEVEGAKFAAGKASNAGVKAFANKLVKDHAAANAELMSLMKKKQISMTSDENPAPEAWRAQTGAAFDRAFIEHAITEHEKTIALFETEAKDGTDAEIKAWAAKKLPGLRAHLKSAQDLKAKLPTTN